MKITALNWMVTRYLGNDPSYTGSQMPPDPNTVLGTPSGDFIRNNRGSKLSDYFSEGIPFTLKDFERGCIEHSVIKTLGDFGQVLTTVTNNGGYIQGPFYIAQTEEIEDTSKPYLYHDQVKSTPRYTPLNARWTTPPDKLPFVSELVRFKPPLDINLGRIGIHGDQPATALAMFLTLFGENITTPGATPGMSENTMSLLHKKESKKAKAPAKIYGAYRGLERSDPALVGAATGGARKKKKNKKTKKARKKKRYTKKKGVTRLKPKTNKKHKKSRRPRRKARKTRRKRMSKR